MDGPWFYSFASGSRLIVEAIAEFGVNFPGLVPVESAEGDTIIQFHAAVGYIQPVQRNGVLFPEIFAHRQIESGVSGQISPRIRLAGKGVAETGTIINIHRDIAAPGEIRIPADIQSVALIVIERRQACGQGKISQAAGNGPAALCDLIRVCQMNLGPMRDARRTQCEFPTTNHGLADGDRKEQIRLPNIVVVEEIHHVGPEIVGVESPTAIRNGDAKLMFFIAFAVQGDKSQIAGLSKIEQWAGRRNQGWRLVILSVEGAK